MRHSHPAPSYCFAVDGALSTMWYSTTTPLLVGLRSVGLFHPKPFPADDLSWRYAIVTDADCGVGKYVTFHLSKMGASVIMTVKDVEHGKSVMKELVEELKKHNIVNPTIQIMRLDLCDIESVKLFVTDFKSKNIPLHILVNYDDWLFQKTMGHEEKSFFKKFLGSFKLTSLLYDNLREALDSRVINVSSPVHHYGTTNWEEAAMRFDESTKSFSSQFQSFANANLGMMLMTTELRRRFERDGSSATAFAVSIGNVQGDPWPIFPKVLHLPCQILMKIVFLTPLQGCHPIITAATLPKEEIMKLSINSDELPVYLQPYWNPLKQSHPFDILGPYSGTDVGIPSLPPNHVEEGRHLWDICDDLLQTEKIHKLDST